MPPGEPPSSDDSLIRRIHDGDEAAFKDLFERYADRLRACVRRWMPRRVQRKVSIADVMQEAYVVAYRRLAEFEQRDEKAFGRWLARIAELKAREAVRLHQRDRRSTRREVTRGARVDTANFPGEGRTPSQLAMAGERGEKVESALAELPEDYRAVLNLVFREQLPLKEVAERMGRSHDAVKKLYGRALCRFQQAYQAPEQG